MELKLGHKKEIISGRAEVSPEDLGRKKIREWITVFKNVENTNYVWLVIHIHQPNIIGKIQALAGNSEGLRKMEFCLKIEHLTICAGNKTPMNACWIQLQFEFECFIFTLLTFDAYYHF